MLNTLAKYAIFTNTEIGNSPHAYVKTRAEAERLVSAMPHGAREDSTIYPPVDSYGTLEHDGRTIDLLAGAQYTARILYGRDYNDRFHNGGKYDFEMSAVGVDKNGQKVRVFWIFEYIENQDLDEYPYDTQSIDRIENIN